MTYIEISEEEFDIFTSSRNYTQFEIEGTNEKVYAKDYGDLKVLIYSTIEHGISREKGKDAIRSVIRSTKLNMDIGGSKKTLRTGVSSLDVFERLTTKLEQLEQEAETLSDLYTKLPIHIVENADTMLSRKNDIILILSKIEKGKTKKDTLKYNILMKTNFILKDRTPILFGFNVTEDGYKEIFDEDDVVGKMYNVISITKDISLHTTGRAQYVNLGKYGYIFNRSDFYLTHLIETDILKLEPPEPVQDEPDDGEADFLETISLLKLETAPEPRNIAEETRKEKEEEIRKNNLLFLVEEGILTEPEFDQCINEGTELEDILEHADNTNLSGIYDFYLNPMQHKVWNSQAIQTGKNLIVASPTASGKTVIAEMAIKKAVDNLQVGIYLAPMKALVEEKMDDWKEVFPEEEIQILTGDYELTPAQQSKLADTDIIVMTNEMLNSRCTKYKTENNQWLKEVGCIVVDEAHLIGSSGRGDKLEVSLMQFTKINPDAQIILLSATLSQLEKLQEWITLLNGKETELITSNYRPCKLTVEYRPFNDYKGVWDFEEKYRETVKAVDRNPADKYIIFCSSRKDSFLTSKRLRDEGYNASTHNATLTLSERRDIEYEFKNGNLQIIASTPTLSIGVNLPAKRVIVQSVYRGLNEIESMEILQCIGRAGRPKYDTEGFATVLLPRSEMKIQEMRLRTVILESVLSRERDLLFHVNNQIYMGEIEDLETAKDWWKRTLAYKLTGNEISIEDILDKLVRMNMIKLINNDDETLYISDKLGRISSMLYHYPDDVLTWMKNFNHIKNKELFYDDLALAGALVNVSQIESAPYVTKDERPELNKFLTEHGTPNIDRTVDEVYLKYTMHNHWALTDKGNKSVVNNIRNDTDRFIACLQLIDALHGWGEKDEWSLLGLRLKYGVKREAVQLVKIKGVGKARAEKLVGMGIYNANDIVRYKERVMKAFGGNTPYEIIKQAEYITGRQKRINLRK